MYVLFQLRFQFATVSFKEIIINMEVILIARYKSFECVVRWGKEEQPFPPTDKVILFTQSNYYVELNSNVAHVFIKECKYKDWMLFWLLWLDP